MPHLKVLYCLCLCAFAFFSNAKALRAVTTEHRLLQYQDDGIAKGPSAEIFRLLMAKAGINSEIEFMPWARAYQIAENTPNTIIFSIIRNEEREQKFHWILPVSQVLQTFIGKSRHTSKTQYSLGHIEKHLTVVVRNTLAHNVLLKQGFTEGENLYVVSTLKTALQLFFDNKVDFIFTEPNVVRKQLANHQLIETDLVMAPILSKAIKKKLYCHQQRGHPGAFAKTNQSRQNIRI